MKRCNLRWKCRIVSAASLIGLLVFPGVAMADIDDDVRALIVSHRRILVLHASASTETRAEARRAGQFLFFSNQQIVRRLIHEVTSGPGSVSERYAKLILAMDDTDYAPEDRLALRAPLEAMARVMPPREHADALQRLGEMARLRASLGAEFGDALRHVPLKPHHPDSPRWQAYVARLTQTQGVAEILADIDRELMAADRTEVEGSDAAARARVLEWNGEELPEKVVLLTFDDGPHGEHTPAVLDILRSHGVRAVFFQVGRNLGEVVDGVARADRHAEVEARIVAEGHGIGNHSYSHPVLPRLAPPAIEREIADTQMLIEAAVPVGPARTQAFRPPYGARDEKVLARIEQSRLRSVVWNIDSEDWADPLPDSIAHRVVRETEKAGRGIILMHDIHGRAVDALPVIIAELKRRGFRFAYWDGRQLAYPGNGR